MRSIALDGGSAAVCLTCDIVNCSFVSPSFSSTGRYYVLGCRGPGIPKWWVKSTSGAFEWLVEDNADVEANLNERLMPRVEYGQPPIGGGYRTYAVLTILMHDCTIQYIHVCIHV